MEGDIRQELLPTQQISLPCQAHIRLRLRTYKTHELTHTITVAQVIQIIKSPAICGISDGWHALPQLHLYRFFNVIHEWAARCLRIDTFVDACWERLQVLFPDMLC